MEENKSNIVTAEQAKQQSIDIEVTDLNMKIRCAAISKKTHIKYLGKLSDEVIKKLGDAGFNVAKKRFCYKISW